jgi:hypothetical protein
MAELKNSCFVKPGDFPKEQRMQCLMWFIVLLLGIWAGPCWARGGGGCLMEGTSILTPSGILAVEHLKEGDPVWAVSGHTLVKARVAAMTKLNVEAYTELSAGETSLFVTSEHPVMVGPGEFRVAGRIQPGERVVVSRGNKLQEEWVRSLRRVEADKPAYNIIVSPGGTFISDGIVVHNKGCFLPDSLILTPDGREVLISKVRRGDTLLAFTSEGRIVRTRVSNVLRREVDEHVVLRTDRETLRATVEHPFYVGEGTFKTLEVLRPGDDVIAWDGQALARQRIVSIERIPGRTQVYNLQTEYPHTFFVGHVAVHNKGGGGGCFAPALPLPHHAGKSSSNP